MSSEGRLFLDSLCRPSRLVTCLGNRSLHWDVQVGSSEPKVLVPRNVVNAGICFLRYGPCLSRCLCNQPDNTGLLHPVALDHLQFASVAIAAAEESYSPGALLEWGLFEASVWFLSNHFPGISLLLLWQHSLTHSPMPGPGSLNQSLNLGWSQHPTGESLTTFPIWLECGLDWVTCFQRTAQENKALHSTVEEAARAP